MNSKRENSVLPVPAWCPSTGALTISEWSTREKLLLTAPISGCVWEPKWELIELGNTFTSLWVPSGGSSCGGALPVTVGAAAQGWGGTVRCHQLALGRLLAALGSQETTLGV